MRVKGLVRISVATLALAAGLAGGAAAQVASMSRRPPRTSRRRRSSSPPSAARRTCRTSRSRRPRSRAISSRTRRVQRLSDLQFAAPSLSVTDQGLTQSGQLARHRYRQRLARRGERRRAIHRRRVPAADRHRDELLRHRHRRGPARPPGDAGRLELHRRRDLHQHAEPSTAGVEGGAEAYYGSYDAFGVQGAVNLPISDTLAVRVAEMPGGATATTPTWGRSITAPIASTSRPRASACWGSLDSFRALAKVEWIDKKTGGYAYRPMPGPLSPTTVRTIIAS